MDQLGWSEPVGLLQNLGDAVKILAQGRGKTADRLGLATSALISLRAEHVPERMRGTVQRIQAFMEHRRHYGSSTIVVASPRERATFVADLLALHKACLIDVGRMWPMWDFVYPDDSVDAKRRRNNSDVRGDS
jgi:hypothetical protein